MFINKQLKKIEKLMEIVINGIKKVMILILR